MIAAPGLDPPMQLRARLADLYCAYSDVLDEGELERWPGFFTADCLYKVMPRENFEQDLPIALIYLYRMYRFGLSHASELYCQFLLLPPQPPIAKRPGNVTRLPVS